ncbi:MAG: Gentisate 1,2-dioxygenase [Chloroflexi bacterium]|nr:Gentisate 1,2-dioxygenase [Chloroflexota bacterium]
MNPDAEGAVRTRNRSNTAYKRWQRGEGVPVYHGSYVEDLHTTVVADWPRVGQKGALISLADQEEDDGWLIELAPGGKTNVLRHAFEASIYVVDGRGATTFWQEGGPKQTVEWQRGSIFAPPINCMHQHFNLDGQRPTRLFAVTAAPMAINMYRNPKFVFENPFVFEERYAGQDDYFSDAGQKLDSAEGTGFWKTNFIPDIRSFKLEPAARGLGTTGMQFILAANSSVGHCSQFPAGAYKQAHRHGVGAHVIILDGTGYSLMWFDDKDEPRRVDWRDGTVISPKEWEYHQHFNTSPIPARYMAFRLGDLDTRRPEEGRGWNTKEEVRGIPYDRENPAIYDLYEKECAKHGASITLPHPNYIS